MTAYHTSHLSGQAPASADISPVNSDPSKRSVLIVDDSQEILNLYSALLGNAGITVKKAASLQELWQNVSERFYDAILLDVYLEDGISLEIVSEIIKVAPLTKIIIMTSHDSVQLAVKSMELGASGFLLKNLHAAEFQTKFESFFSTPMDKNVHFDFNPREIGLVGNSAAIRDVLNNIQRIKDVDSTVLLTGETGTGKEVVAKAIHNLSPRKSGQFLAINCAAISETLLEAELFGCKKGAYTDAKADRKGFFETCSDGTLLLDEIGEMAVSLQAKLLRVLQEKEIVPIGSCRPIKIGTRIIASTNRDLRQEVEKGNFREDLFYRLSILQIHLPPLRDRMEDLPELMDSFVATFNKKLGKSMRSPSHYLLARLRSYQWPGNIRELHNSVERAIILATANEMRLEDLLPFSELSKKNAFEAAQDLSESMSLPVDYIEAKQGFETAYIRRLLRITGGNITEAANISGQYRANIYRMVKKHGLNVKEISKPSSELLN